ncbi:MAG: hypothetical protein KAH22_01185 [Thiotrichaceae bacterium]|nr:hypothetical protein [Thiotrichaceae bacterium]
MNKVKIILCTDSTDSVPAWIYHSIEKINHLNSVEIVAVISPIARNKKRQINDLFIKLIKLIKKPVMNKYYLSSKKLNSLIHSDIPHFIMDRIDSTQLPSYDLIINYTFQRLQTKQDKVIWYHLFNEKGELNTSNQGIKETYLNQPILSCQLRSQTSSEMASCLLEEASTCPSENSIEESNHFNHWRASALAARALSQLDKPKDTLDQPLMIKETPSLSTFSLIKLFTQYVSRRLQKKIITRKYFEQWVIFYQFIAPEKGSSPIKMQNFTLLLPPKKVFWADPHIVFDDGRYYLFFEELPFATWAGHLMAVEINETGMIGTPKVILKRDYHLSYPHVFKHNDVYYMIPESCENRTIELYQCTSFPYQWEFVMNLMEDVYAVDTTLYFEDNRCWLLTSLSTIDEAPVHDELNIYYSDKGFQHQNWIPHNNNPVVSSVTSARPAGKLFQQNGKLYRPSQDCSQHYGYGYNLNEVTILSTDQYEEELVQKVRPDWDKQIIATHTYNQSGNLIVSDGVLLRRKSSE